MSGLASLDREKGKMGVGVRVQGGNQNYNIKVKH